jgi:hypothetical protein
LTSDSTTRPPIRCGFEPVSAETQPVSGRPLIQFPDIEKSSSRDSPRDSRLSVRFLQNSWRETGSFPSNLRKCRHFRRHTKFPWRDPGGWLGRQDSNLGMAESKSAPPHPGSSRRFYLLVAYPATVAHVGGRHRRGAQRCVAQPCRCHANYFILHGMISDV